MGFVISTFQKSRFLVRFFYYILISIYVLGLA